MVTIFMLAIIVKRRIRPWYLLCISLLLILLWNPFAIFSTGFYLSFAAVGIILYGVCYRRIGQRRGIRFGRVQLFVTLGLLPLSLYFFANVSLMSPLANLLAIPWVSFLVVPPSLLAALVSLFSENLAEWIFQLTAWDLYYLWWLLQYISKFQFADYQISVVNITMLFGLIFAVLWLLAPRALPGRVLSVFGILPFIFPNIVRPEQNEFWLTVLDVGQGLSIVVETMNHRLIYDTGPKFHSGFDAGKQVMIPFLLQKRVSQVDTLVISHADNDHIGGAESILQKYPAKQVFTSQQTQLLDIEQQLCHRGIQWQWDGVEFEFLYPSYSEISVLPLTKRLNNVSCVLKVTVGDYSVLLPGDIEKEAENQLVRNFSENLRADILIAPHHGSQTSSTYAFVKAVKPKYVIYSMGYLNRYRFPSAKVVARYTRQKVQQLDTATSGAITFKLSRNKGISEPLSYRELHRSIWQ